MWEYILNEFSNLTFNQWVAQILGTVGFIIITISYQLEKKKFLFISGLSIFFFIAEGIFADLWSSVIVSIICLARNILMLYFMIKHKKEAPLWSVLTLIGVMWIAEIIMMACTKGFDRFDNYLTPAIITFSTFTQNNKRTIVVKAGATIHESGYLTYYILKHLPISVFRQIILVSSALISVLILAFKEILKKARPVNFNKAIVLGCPGAGKSYLSRYLKEYSGIELFYLDHVFWKENWEHISTDEFRNKVKEIMVKDKWIIDGNYFKTLEDRLKKCDTVFFLDLDTETCVKSEALRRGQKREDLPSFLVEKDDPDFVKYIKDFKKEQRPGMLKLFKKYKDKKYFIFKTRKEVNEFINKLK